MYLINVWDREELAQIKSIKPRKKGIRYSISADFVMDDIKIGDSISVNGVFGSVPVFPLNNNSSLSHTLIKYTKLYPF